MNKHEVELEKARLEARRFQGWIGLAAHTITVFGGVAVVYFIFDGLRPLIVGQSPEAIAALAKVVEAVNPATYSGYLFGAVATGAWWLERKGKKRAIQRKSDFQKELEAGDKNRTSSGLTPTGDTPKED